MPTITAAEAGLRRIARQRGYTILKARDGYALVDADRRLVADNLDIDGLAEELSARCKE